MKNAIEKFALIFLNKTVFFKNCKTCLTLLSDSTSNTGGMRDAVIV